MEINDSYNINTGFLLDFFVVFNHLPDVRHTSLCLMREINTDFTFSCVKLGQEWRRGYPEIKNGKYRKILQPAASSNPTT